MWSIPKKHFKWQEPKEFRRTLSAVEASKRRWWHKPVAGLIVACFLITLWVFARLVDQQPGAPFGVIVALALPVGQFLVYFMTWAHRLPSSVMVFDDCLLQMNGKRTCEWRYKDIASFAIHDCAAFRVLVLETRGGQQSLVGVPSEVDLSALESFLCARGLAQVPPGQQTGHAADGRSSLSRHPVWAALAEALDGPV